MAYWEEARLSETLLASRWAGQPNPPPEASALSVQLARPALPPVAVVPLEEATAMLLVAMLLLAMLVVAMLLAAMLLLAGHAQPVAGVTLLAAAAGATALVAALVAVHASASARLVES